MTQLPLEDLDAAIALSEDGLRSLLGGRVLMTGGTGFFGVWLLQTLQRARARLGVKCDVVLLSRDPARFLGTHPTLDDPTWLHLHRGDVRDFPFPDGSFSHVVHGATTSAHETFAGEPPLRKFDTVAMGTRHVLELCSHKAVPDMLYLGSGAVYGRSAQGGALMREDEVAAPDPLDVGSALGEAKRVAELFCAVAAAAGPTRIKIARCFSFVGPLLPLDIHYAIGNFIGDAVAGRPITLKGTGRPVRSYLYTSDLVAWLITILVRGRSQRAYNVGSEDGRPLLEVAQLVASLAGVAVARPAMPGPTPTTAAPDCYAPSTARARDELGLSQTVSLEEGLRKTLAFHGKRVETTARTPRHLA